MEKKYLLAIEIIGLILVIVLIAIFFTQPNNNQSPVEKEDTLTNLDTNNSEDQNNITQIDTNISINDMNIETNKEDNENETFGEVCGNSICEANEITNGNCPMDCE